VTDKAQNKGIDDELLKSSYDRLKEVQPPESLDRRILAMAEDSALSTSGRGVSSWSIWRYRLAAAATIVLAVSVTLQLLTDPGHDALPEPGLVLSADDIQLRQAPTAVTSDRLPAETMEVEQREKEELQAVSRMAADSGVASAEEADQEQPGQRSRKAVASQSNVVASEIPVLESMEMVAPLAASIESQDSLSVLDEPVMDTSGLAEELREKPDDWLVAIDELIENDEKDFARREIALFRERWPDRELDEKYDID